MASPAIGSQKWLMAEHAKRCPSQALAFHMSQKQAQKNPKNKMETNMQEKTSTFQFIKEVVGICLAAPKKDKRAFWLVVILFGCSAGLSALMPVISAKVLNNLQDSLSASVVTGILIAWTVLYIFFYQSLEWFYGAADTFVEVVFRRYNTLFCQEKTKAFLNMPMLLLSSDFRQKAVSLIPRIGRNGENMLYNVTRITYPFFHLIASVLLLIGLLPLWSIVIFLLSILYCMANIWINKKLANNMDAVMNAETANDVMREDTLENAGNIRALGIEQKVLNELQQKYETFHQLNQKYRMQQIWLSFIPTWLNIISYLLIAFISVYLAFQQKNIGAYVMLTGLGFDVLNHMVRIANQFKWLHLNGMDYLRLNKQMDYDSTLIPKSGKGKLTAIKEIALEKVCFTYPEEKSPVLNNLSLKIKAGSRVAIIGNSGMGKSTLINVMQHAYEIQSGKVLYNGKNVQTISRESLRDNLTYIDQHPTFWSQKTIKENLLMFNPKATEAELYQALQLANLLDEIMKKEKKIDSKVTSLSAGQKQRLSLARALLRHTPLIIMDEPTANLDTHAQTKVLEGIKNLSKVKGHKPTVIFASNVPAEIASANRILLLENGQIVEDGSPKKLMANENSKTYKRLKKYKALFEE